MSTVLVDARNVQRSQWPNLTDEELIERARAWAERHDADLVLVFDGQALGGVGPQRLDERTTLVGTGGESADAWLVTSDRALREAAGKTAGRIVGGGSFLRGLDD
jgi:hypothetical protein